MTGLPSATASKQALGGCRLTKARQQA